MSSYSVIRSKREKEETIDMKTGTPLAIGGIIGGLAGQTLFQFFKEIFENQINLERFSQSVFC
jgi:uncharacterized membrane protein YfcA